MAWFEVLSAGMFTTVQDRGRPGFGAVGLPVSGAADTEAHDAANRLVGNASGAATLEVTGGGLILRSVGSTVVAVTGARVDVTVGADATRHSPAGDWSRIRLRDNDILALGAPWSGLRSYVAVRGGIDVPEVLGSRSTDTLSQTGPDPIRTGDRLLVGALARELPAEEQFPPPAPTADPLELRVRRGPRDDWFTSESLRALLTRPWTASPQLDRIGIRFRGPGPLHRTRRDELPSEGMTVGSLQVPPEGNPVLFLADHPVTGGYPVIAVVIRDDLSKAAQVRPGHRVRFVLSH